MKKISLFALALPAALLASCTQERRDPETLPPPPPSQGSDDGVTPPAPPVSRHGYLAESLVIAEWRKAENWNRCKPIALLNELGQPATARRADFSNGWSVAFDTPTKRSAYGVAGVGIMPDDLNESDASKRSRLQSQWPHFMELRKLPQPSFAGYGISGAQAYPASNPRGTGLHSLAYVRVGGQKCLYNVWSNISRAHLEQMLDNLRVIENPNG